MDAIFSTCIGYQVLPGKTVNSFNKRERKNNMLKKLRIQNFKIWEDTGTIRLAPLTLLFGANSSGKSSIGQFLLMLKQTVESRSQDVFYLGDSNSAVQLGSYEDIIFQRDMQKQIKFEYQWSSQLPIRLINPDPYQMFSGDDLAFQAEVGSHSLTRRPQVKRLNYKLIAANGKTQLSFGMKIRSHTRGYYELESPNFTIKMISGMANRSYSTLPQYSPDHFYGFPRQLITAYQNQNIFREFNETHEEFFSNLFYLGPIRMEVNRLYENAGGIPESVGYKGEDTIAAILAAKAKDKIFEEREDRFEHRITSRLKQIGLIEDLKIKEFSDRVCEIKVQTKGSKTWVELPDVGFGVSQVLPVLVQCFYAPEGSIILIDQPEVHLHPYAQSALADVMIDVIKNRNIQLIIETHSEHFLRRLQRRIAEDKLTQDHVSAYFANINPVPLNEIEEISEERRNSLEKAGILSANDLSRTSLSTLLEIPNIAETRAKFLHEIAEKNVEKKERAKLEPLDIDEYGNIRNWPENFFGDEMEDILARAKAEIEGQKAEIERQKAEIERQKK